MMGTNLKVVAIVVGTLAIFTVVANMIPQLESDVPEELAFTAQVTPEELVEAGEQLYQGAGGCTACHGLGTRAPNLLTDEAGTGSIGARCATRVTGQSCKEYLHDSLVDPEAYVVAGYQAIMPDASRTLSDAQVWALVAFLESQGGDVTVTADDLEEAGAPADEAASAPTAASPAQASITDPHAILEANQCLLCHALAGAGGPIGPPLDGLGARRSPDEIRRKILDPASDTAPGYEALAGTMPATFGQQMTAAQLEAVVTYLSSMR